MKTKKVNFITPKSNKRRKWMTIMFIPHRQLKSFSLRISYPLIYFFTLFCTSIIVITAILAIQGTRKINMVKQEQNKLSVLMEENERLRKEINTLMDRKKLVEITGKDIEKTVVDQLEKYLKQTFETTNSTTYQISHLVQLETQLGVLESHLRWSLSIGGILIGVLFTIIMGILGIQMTRRNQEYKRKKTSTFSKTTSRRSKTPRK